MIARARSLQPEDAGRIDALLCIRAQEPAAGAAPRLDGADVLALQVQARPERALERSLDPVRAHDAITRVLGQEAQLHLPVALRAAALVGRHGCLRSRASIASARVGRKSRP